MRALSMRALGDRIGRRGLLTIGAAVLGLPSLLAAVSRTAEMLVVARAPRGRWGRDRDVGAHPDRAAAGPHRRRVRASATASSPSTRSSR